jgi:DHA1 family multidrug resistance protein-like MFS transporter
VVLVVARWKYTLVASWLAQICSLVGFAMVVPFLPYYVRELGVSSDRGVLIWTGWLSAAAGIVMAAVSPLWGILADRHGRKLMVMRSMFGGVIVIGLMAYVQNVHQLLGLRIMQGILTGTVAASVALISAVVPTRRAGFALGLMHTAVYVGSSLGPGIGGRLSEALGYRIPFLVAAGFLLIGGLLTLFGVQEEFDREEMEAQGAVSVGQVVRVTGFTTMAVLLFMVMFSGSFMAPILPLFIEKLSGVAVGAASRITGDILALAGVAAAVSATILGRLGDRLGYTRVLTICTLLTGLTLIPHAFVHNPTQLLYWRLATSFAGAGTIPAINALIRNLVPRHACGKAFGLMQSISCLGWGVGPAVGSVAAAAMGLARPFIIVGVLFVAISVLVVRLAPRMARLAQPWPQEPVEEGLPRFEEGTAAADDLRAASS